MSQFVVPDMSHLVIWWNRNWYPAHLWKTEVVRTGSKKRGPQWDSVALKEELNKGTHFSHVQCGLCRKEPDISISFVLGWCHLASAFQEAEHEGGGIGDWGTTNSSDYLKWENCPAVGLCRAIYSVPHGKNIKHLTLATLRDHRCWTMNAPVWEDHC